MLTNSHCQFVVYLLGFGKVESTITLTVVDTRPCNWTGSVSACLSGCNTTQSVAHCCNTGTERFTASPGPGSYSPSPSSHGPTASLKFRHNSRLSGATGLGSGLGTSLGSTQQSGALPDRRASPAYSLAARLPAAESASTPGPGQYDHE